MGAGSQDMYEDEFNEEEVTTEYVQCAGVLINLHTVVSDTLHDEPLNSAHSKEVARDMDEMNKLIKEKVIIRDTGEGIILKNGQPAYSLYGDRTHLYIPRRYWLDWGKNRHRHVRRLGHAPEWTGMLLTASDGQVCCAAWVEQTLSAKTVKNLTWLLFYVPPYFEFQLGRASAVLDASTECSRLGT